jgi:predicted DNA-binding transcriptional regulator AlpA
MAEPAANEFLTKKELAKLCRCSERTVDRLLENGDGPPLTHLAPRRIIFHAPSAREWLAKRTVGAAPHSLQGSTNGDTPRAGLSRRRGRRNNDTATQAAPPRRGGQPSKPPEATA